MRKLTLNLFLSLAVLVLSTSISKGQYFNACMDAEGNELVFYVCVEAGGNLNTASALGISGMEFMVQYSSATVPAGFSLPAQPTPNAAVFNVGSADFIQNALPGGATVAGKDFIWIGWTGLVIPGATYNAGQCYEVFRVDIGVDPTLGDFELAHNSGGFPFYFTANGGDGLAYFGEPNFGGAAADIFCTTPSNRMSGGDRFQPLTWVTAMEENVSHFDVMRSTNGLKWSKVGEVLAAGDTNEETKYNFIDSKVYSKNGKTEHYYYKLNMVEKDGSSAFSDVRQVTFDSDVVVEAAELTVFPNPTSTQFTVSWENFQENSRYELIDGLGRVVRSSKVIDSETQFSVEDLANGLYFIRAMVGNTTMDTKRVIVAKD